MAPKAELTVAEFCALTGLSQSQVRRRLLLPEGHPGRIARRTVGEAGRYSRIPVGEVARAP